MRQRASQPPATLSSRFRRAAATTLDARFREATHHDLTWYTVAMPSPTVMISWSHSEPGWSEAATDARLRGVLRLADWLRLNGVDAKLDVYEQQRGVDWSRWGPRHVIDADVVLIVATPSWKEAWEGVGDPHRSAGAAGEADVLRSLYARDRADFVRRTRLILMPEESTDAIPMGLHGITRYQLSGLTDDAMTPLLRDLTGQYAYPAPPLGQVPVLPPVDGAGVVDLIERHHSTELGQVQLVVPVVRHVGGAKIIMDCIDELVTHELTEFDDNESRGLELLDDAAGAVVNYAQIIFAPTLVAPRLLSLHVACSYGYPGAATAYQRGVGMVFDSDTGNLLTSEDIFIPSTGWRTALEASFRRAAIEMLGESEVANRSLPEGLAFVVDSTRFGVVTSRYDPFSGYVGAPIVWVDHSVISRFYRPQFARLLPGA